eukprot:TRINITY_DN5378_c0_g1_i3.p1 TRINITY_DN5378_c0_g1~~TRINITY_DN5378_c0_g1_i3.p1  ORF type:complete len:219 (-),score=4.19 TRINITY_DN5378_c0_g1_i3:60-716(-)
MHENVHSCEQSFSVSVCRAFIIQSASSITSSCAKFSRNGMFALVSSLSSQISLWDFNRGEQLRIYNGHKNINFLIENNFASLGGRQKLVFAPSEEGNIRFWDVQKPELSATLEPEIQMKSGIALAFDDREPDTNRFFVSDQGNSIKIYNFNVSFNQGQMTKEQTFYLFDFLDKYIRKDHVPLHGQQFVVLYILCGLNLFPKVLPPQISVVIHLSLIHI